VEARGYMLAVLSVVQSIYSSVHKGRV